MRLMKNNKGFTLAEVLITLGIIGVVAAITLPAIIQNYQKMVLKNQFKKSYAIAQNAWIKAEADMGYKPECYYWNKSPYGSAKCVSYNTNGDCTKYELVSGGDLPGNYNGNMGECSAFKTQLEKNFLIAKKCVGNAFKNHCIPDYKGNDTVYREGKDEIADVDVNKATSGCSAWREQNIKNAREVWNLADGTIILWYSGPQLFAMDINGMKGPNKWGYDLFPFRTTSNQGSPLKISPGGCDIIEKGGVSTSAMLKNLY